MAQYFLNQLWQTWEMAWYRTKTEVSGHVVLAVVAILLLFWLFLSPKIKNK
jgi:hypothetical protein